MNVLRNIQRNVAECFFMINFANMKKNEYLTV
jgi:hypothetical protein